MLKQEAANHEWLAHAFTLPLNSMERSCYYDSQQQNFFALTLQDFIVQDTDDLVASHSRSDQAMISDKLQRLKVGDNTIIPIPRLSSADRQALQSSFADQFKGMYHHTQLLKVISEQDDNVGLALDKFFNTHNHFEEIQSLWKAHREQDLAKVINQFAETYHINLPFATIWALSRPSTALTIKAPSKYSNKPWWHIW